jgi:hypothetical protein
MPLTPAPSTLNVLLLLLLLVVLVVVLVVRSVWTSVVHDSAHGHLTSVVMTPDGQHLVTAAQDGTLLMLASPHPQPAAAAAAAAVPLPALAQDASPEAADITGREALTLQQQAAAAEAQQAAAAAVAAKEQRQRQLQQLRQELESLMAVNRSRPEGQRLPEEAFHIDQGKLLGEEVEQGKRARASHPLQHSQHCGGWPCLHTGGNTQRKHPATLRSSPAMLSSSMEAGMAQPRPACTQSSPKHPVTHADPLTPSLLPSTPPPSLHSSLPCLPRPGAAVGGGAQRSPGGGGGAAGLVQ